jgi:hypothetical protein
LTAKNGYGTAKDAAEKYYLPNAIKASRYARKWVNSASTQMVIDTTENLLFERKAGAVVAEIINPLSGSSVSGIVTIQYAAEAIANPVDIILDIDDNQLEMKNNVNSGYYQYSWNSALFNDGLPHNLHLKVTDSNGAIAEENVIGPIMIQMIMQ